MTQRAPGRARRAAGRLLLGLLLAICTGCGLFPPAPPPLLSRAEVLYALRRAPVEFRTLVDTDISLSITAPNEEGEPERLPRLGGHIAFDRELPGLWLDARKVGRPVFSLRAMGMRFWLADAQEQRVYTGGPTAYMQMPYLLRPEEVRALFTGPDALGVSWPDVTMRVEPEAYVFEIPLAGAPYRRVRVDRRELAVTTITDYDVRGRVVTRVTLDDYEAADGRPMPRRLVVERPRQDVRIELRLGNPKLDKTLKPRTFMPLEWPGWERVNLDAPATTPPDA